MAHGLRAIAIMLAAATAAGGGCAGSPRSEGPLPSVEFRLAEFEPREAFVEARSRDGETLWIAPEPVLTLEDFSTSLIRRQASDDFLLLNVKAGSRIRLDAATMPHLDRPVVVMIDGTIVYVPTLKTSISRQVPVRIGPRGITRDEALRITDAIADLREFGARPLQPPVSPQEPAPPAPASHP